MSDLPDRSDDHGDDPLSHLPPELRRMLEQLGGPEALEQAAERFQTMFAGGFPGMMAGMPPSAGSGAPTGPVDWQLATRVALQVAADGDRAPTSEETTRLEQAFALAEHWLDATPLPSPPDAGQVVIGSRQAWVNAATTSLAPLVEPVARAATDAMVSLAREQLEGQDLDELLGELPGADQLPPQLSGMLEQALGDDPAGFLRPAGASLAGLQAGQVIGQLSRQLLGQYDLGIPTAPRASAYHLAVNAADDLDGYDVERSEIDLVLALTESAHRRLYHAVPWLEAHVASLVARFAAGTTVDADRMREVAEELTLGLDPEDPEALQAAMERASSFRLTPTEDQQRVLERLQAVVCLVGAWARHEVVRAVEGRLPSIDRIQEILRRRRAVRGDGEALLDALLGLDLRPADESLGDGFVRAIEEELGADGLHQAMAHPENLPDSAELASPEAWIARVRADGEIPDDLAGLFASLGEAPREASAEERLRDDPDQDGDPDQDDEPGQDDDPGGPSGGSA